MKNHHYRLANKLQTKTKSIFDSLRKHPRARASTYIQPPTSRNRRKCRPPGVVGQKHPRWKSIFQLNCHGTFHPCDDSDSDSAKSTRQCRRSFVTITPHRGRITGESGKHNTSSWHYMLCKLWLMFRRNEKHDSIHLHPRTGASAILFSQFQSAQKPLKIQQWNSAAHLSSH